MKKIIAISGSSRKGSFNMCLLKNAANVLPEGMQMEIIDISSIPMYNKDIESPLPESVRALKDTIEGADGIIFATPEYNRSIPGFLKNAIDWASRPSGSSSFPGKAVLVLGASTGVLGTAVAQAHLKQVMLHLGTKVVGKPEFHLGNAAEKFDSEGTLTDEPTREYLKKALEVFAGYIA